MVTNKKFTKIGKLYVLQVNYFSLKFVETVFVFCIISSQEMIESSIMLAKYLPFLQLHVAVFQI